MKQKKNVLSPTRMKMIRNLVDGTIDEFIDVMKQLGVKSSLSRNHVVNRAKDNKKDVLFTDEADIHNLIEHLRIDDSDEASELRESIKTYYQFTAFLLAGINGKKESVYNRLSESDTDVFEEDEDDLFGLDDEDDDDAPDPDELDDEDLEEGFSSIDDLDDEDFDDDLDEDFDDDLDDDLDEDFDDDLDDEDFDDDDLDDEDFDDDLDDEDFDDEDFDEDEDDLGLDDDHTALNEFDDLDDFDDELDDLDGDGEAWSDALSNPKKGRKVKKGQTIDDDFENGADDEDEYDFDNVEIGEYKKQL